MTDLASDSMAGGTVLISLILFLDLFLQKRGVVVSSIGPRFFVNAGLDVFATGAMFCPLLVQEIGTGAGPIGGGTVKGHRVQTRSTKFKVDNIESFRQMANVHKRSTGRNQVAASGGILTSVADWVVGSEAGVGHLFWTGWALYIEFFSRSCSVVLL